MYDGTMTTEHSFKAAMCYFKTEHFESSHVHHFGILTRVDITMDYSILRRKFIPKSLTRFTESFLKIPARPSVIGYTAAFPLDHVKLRIHEAKCSILTTRKIPETATAY